MSIEVRPYTGDIDQLCEFALSGWLRTYAGRGIVPMWTPDHFRWHMPELAANRFEEVIAAYDGDLLVGVLPCEKVPIRLKGQDTMSTMGGWLTVREGYMRRGVGRLLIEGMATLNARVGAPFLGGFVNTGRIVGRGRQFWTSTSQTTVFEKPIMWARVLDAASVARAMWSRFEALEAYAGRASALPFPIGARHPAIRMYAHTDIDQCHALFERHMQFYDIAYRWDRGRLDHHLGFGRVAQTLVFETGGKISGFVNFNLLDAMGKAKFRMGIIDTLAPFDMPAGHAIALVRAVLGYMREKQVGLAIILGPGTNPATTLICTGFLPMLSSYKFIGIKMPDCPSFDDIKRIYAHFR